MKGTSWLESPSNDQAMKSAASKDEPSSINIRNPLYAPRNIAISIGVFAIVFVLLFPPHIVPLPQGLVNNAGFGSIFSPPMSGGIVSIVNAPLLALLIVGITLATVGLAFIAHAVYPRDA
jgi:hypothetical protein